MPNSNPDLSVAVVKEQEVERLLDFVEKYFALDHIDFQRESSRTALLKLIANPVYGIALFFKIEAEIVGYGVLAFSFDHEFGGRVAFVTDFFFDEPWRGKGLGSKALAIMEKICEGLGVLSIELHILKENEAARRFYAKNGFAALDRIPMAKSVVRHR